MLTVQAIRGATQVSADDAQEIREATEELVAAVLNGNRLNAESLISVFFTMTPDLTSDFPALPAYECGLADVPMMCAVEINVPNAMPRVIRVMAHVRTERPISALTHPYLRGAAAIRPAAVIAARSEAKE